MPKKILCTLPFATESINGIAFEPVEGGMQTVDVVNDEDAEHFLQIPGFEAVEVEGVPPAKPAKPAKAAE